MTKLFTDSYPAPNALVLSATKKKVVAHFWDFAIFSGWNWQLWDVGAPSHGTRRCISLPRLAQDIKWNEEEGFKCVPAPGYCSLWPVVWKPRPVTACLSDALPKFTSFRNTLLNNDALRQKAPLSLSLSRRTPPPPPPPVSALHHVGQLNSCTLNYSSHLQTKSQPTVIVCISPSANVQRET